MASLTDLQPITAECPKPVEHPLMLQSWRRLTFLHWRCDAADVQRTLPRGLAVDTFDGSAWVGVVPFEIHGLRPPRMPEIPWLSNFAETNVRTYAIGPDGSRGVWFFSLDASRLAAVIGARITYGLPYFWARMSVVPKGGAVEYRSRRSRVKVDIRIQPGLRFPTEELTEHDHFLTARYRLFTLLRGRLAYAPVEHSPWPLARAEIRRLDENLVETAGLPRPVGVPLLHYSEDIHVKVGAPRAF